MINWEMVVVFATIFVAVVLLSLWGARWLAQGELRRLTEWGLAGRRFGTITAWFLLCGTIFTGNSMLATPGVAFGKGAQGFYTMTYCILIYPLLFVVLSRFWVVARHRGYVTVADFAHERFGRTVGLLIALTGILATMPYLAVQIYAMEVTLAQMGLPVEASLIVAFSLLALSTYVGGLRAPALMAIVKMVMLVIVFAVALIVIPMQLGGLAHIFAVVHHKATKDPAIFSDVLLPAQYTAYSTQVLGSALALFLYPHVITVFGSANSHKALKKNAILLQFHPLLNGLAAFLAYMAITAAIAPSSAYKTNSIVPALFARFFPAWFAGFSFAAIVICALVPAAIMSIAVANLFSRNIYREYLNPSCNEQAELKVARWASFFVKCGALVFILIVPITFVNNLQLMGSAWIVQTFPAVFVGLYTTWFHRRALVLGWIGGMVTSTWMIVQQNFGSFYPFKFGPTTISVYIGLAALVVNLLLTAAFTPVFKTFWVAQKQDMIPATDFVGSVS
jgi:solute:Na+ symporter, SSS family